MSLLTTRRAYVLAIGWCIGLVPICAGAHAVVVVNQPWVRPAGAAQGTEVYMNLTSTEGATLVAVRTDGAATATLQGPGRRTSIVRELALPAAKVVELAPGKQRIALHRLIKAVRLGDLVDLTLTLEGADGQRQEIPVSAVARLRSPIDDERRTHRHRH